MSGDSPCPRCHQYYNCVCGDVLASVLHHDSPWSSAVQHPTTDIDSYTWDKALEVAARICIELAPYPAEDKNYELISEWLGKAAQNIRNKKLEID